MVVLSWSKFLEYFRSRTIFKQLLLVIGTSINVAGQTTTTGLTAILLPQLKEPDSGVITSTVIEASLASVVSLGGIFGIFCVPMSLDRLGRKKCHLLTIVPAILGWIMIIYTSNSYVMIAARFIQGFAIGFRMPVSAIIIGECTAPKYRGIFLAAINFSISIGLFYPHVIGTFFSWRITSVACAVLCLISLFIIALVPDSPTWLVIGGRVEEGQVAFEWFRGNEPSVLEEFKAIVDKVAEDNKHEAKDNIGFREIINDRKCWSPFLLVLVSCVAYIGSGVYVLTNYMVDVLSKSFDTSTHSYYVMLAVDILRMIAALMGCYVMKRLNRRTVFTISSWITICSLVSMSIYIYVSRYYNIHKEFILIISLLVYIYGGSGLQAMQYVLIGEVLPVKYKSVASSLALSISTTLAFLALLSAPYLFELAGRDGTFVIYLVIVFLCWVFMHFKLHETKDKTLITIENEIINR